jgi:general secretion pathway protein A
LYEAFYKLKENPFRLTPDPSFMCMTAQHQEALSGLIYSVCTRPGLTILVGEAGTGKTTLLYSLVGLLEKRRFVVAMCNNPVLSREEFYDLLMMKFGIDCKSSLKSRQLAALEEVLQRNRADGRPSVLIVDEAQRLSAELLEEIRLLLNLETPTEKLLQIIVAGQPELGDILRRPELRQLKQRVSCICRLNPLGFEEFREYLYHRLTRAGRSDQNLFSDGAMTLAYQYTQGIPRLINSLCQSALQTGFALQADRITPAMLEEAARDLELAGSAAPEKPPVNGHAFGELSVTGAPAIPPIQNPPPVSLKNGSFGIKQNGHENREVPMPLESYATRQKSVKFFSSLMDRWK